jgi:hypothetical protein
MMYRRILCRRVLSQHPPARRRHHHHHCRLSSLATVGAGSVVVLFATTSEQQQQQQQHRYHSSRQTKTLMEEEHKKKGYDSSKADYDSTSSAYTFDLEQFWNKIMPQEESSTTASSDAATTTTSSSSSSASRESSEGLATRILDLFSDITKEEEKEERKDELQKAIEQEERKKAEQKSQGGFETLAKDFLRMIKGGETVPISDVVATVREKVEPGYSEDSFSLTEIVQFMDQYHEQLNAVADKYTGDVDLSKLLAAQVMYYLEREDEVKNPSWKRRKHRFCPSIDISKAVELNEALSLSLLSYADTVEEIHEGLARHSTPYELVYCTIKSLPGKPAHYVAVKRDQSSSWQSGGGLEVIMVVRGTKSVADAITDALCDSVQYKGGRAHSFILDSGIYLSTKHRDLLEELRKKSGKSRVDLTLLGHSLGAGAASIAGMELHDDDSSNVRVKVIGFGCPALVSKELAVKSGDYITTVVNDSDVVPRLSGNAIANLLRNMLEFDWAPYARRDLEDALHQLQMRQPYLFNKMVSAKILEVVDSALKSYGTAPDEVYERADVELFPPGKCIHFYRDGAGISGCFVPNDFFSEIDVSRRMIDGMCSVSL